MSQHDFDIANQTSGSARTDINNALKALASCSSGATAPSTTYANMLWYDTANDLLKMRNEADSAWITISKIDQTTGAFPYIGTTQITAFLDEDNFASNSATAVATQQSIKAYVDWIGGTGYTNSGTGFAYIPFRNGIIIRVGKFDSTSDDNQEVTFLAPFPNGCLAVLNGGTATNDTDWTPWTANNITAASFYANRSDAVSGTKPGQIYVAIGY